MQNSFFYRRDALSSITLKTKQNIYYILFVTNYPLIQVRFTQLGKLFLYYVNNISKIFFIVSIILMIMMSFSFTNIYIERDNDFVKQIDILLVK
jgi:hypothetical protein